MQMDPARRHYPNDPLVQWRERPNGTIEFYKQGKVIGWTERDAQGNYSHFDGRGIRQSWAVRQRNGTYVTSGEVNAALNLFDRLNPFERLREHGVRMVQKRAVIGIIALVLAGVLSASGSGWAILLAPLGGILGISGAISYDRTENRWWGLNPIVIVGALIIGVHAFQAMLLAHVGG